MTVLNILLFVWVTHAIASPLQVKRLRTCILNKWFHAPANLLSGEEGEYVIEMENASRALMKLTGVKSGKTAVLNVAIQDNTLTVESAVQNAQMTAPVAIALMCVVLKNRRPELKINLSKEYHDAYVQLADKIRNCKPNEELLEWVGANGETVCALPRSIIHSYNLLYRGVAALVLNHKNEVFVHQRSAGKRTFPSMYSMFVTGAISAFETPTNSLLRELEEEVGIDRDDIKSNNLDYLGRTTIETSFNHCVVDTYVLKCTAPMASSIRFNDGEVTWGKWMDIGTFSKYLKRKRVQFVPDGLQVWEALPSMLSDLPVPAPGSNIAKTDSLIVEIFAM